MERITLANPSPVLLMNFSPSAMAVNHKSFNSLSLFNFKCLTSSRRVWEKKLKYLASTNGILLIDWNKTLSATSRNAFFKVNFNSHFIITTWPVRCWFTQKTRTKVTLSYPEDASILLSLQLTNMAFLRTAGWQMWWLKWKNLSFQF